MKSFLAITLIALLINAAFAVPKTHLKASASEDVVVQETAAETDLDNVDNTVDNESSVLNTHVNNAVNDVNVGTAHNVPVVDVAVVQNAPTKTVTSANVNRVNYVSTPVEKVVKTHVAPKNVVNLVSVPVQSVPTTSYNVVKSVQSVPVQTQVTYQQHQPQQWTHSVPTTYSAVKSVQSVPVQTQVTYQHQPQQQQWSVVPQQQQVVYAQQPQQQWSVVSQPQQQWSVVPQHQQEQVVYAQPQQQQWSVVSQPQQEQVVYSQVPKVNVVKSLVYEQPRTVQYTTKTVAAPKLANPIVYQYNPSKVQVSNSRQTVLTGSQLVSDVVDESAKDVVVQEVESNY